MDRLYLGITVTSTYTAGHDGADPSVHAIRPPQLAAISSLSSDPGRHDSHQGQQDNASNQHHQISQTGAVPFLTTAWTPT
jgi:hypothetical protein